MTGRNLAASQFLSELGCVVFERGWLSSNNVLFTNARDETVLVDTGYSSHAAQTVTLVRSQLCGKPLTQIINTHLHSDHCGGNAELQLRWNCTTSVPAASFDAANVWNPALLSFESTGQTCHRFAVNGVVRPGEGVELGGRWWEVFSVPGHDADALMFFEVDSGVLIAGDALWESRLAIIFPELVGEAGFQDAHGTLDRIEALRPSWVIPGHGRPFCDVAGALSRSRARLDKFRRDPVSHAEHAFRALVMFRMLEIRSCGEADLLSWIEKCPIFLRTGQQFNGSLADSHVVVQRLIDLGSLHRVGSQIAVANADV